MISIERMQTGPSQVTQPGADTIETFVRPSGSPPLDVPTDPDRQAVWHPSASGSDGRWSAENVPTGPTLIDRPSGQIPPAAWDDESEDAETREVRTRRPSAPRLPQKRPSQPPHLTTMVGAAPSGMQTPAPPTVPAVHPMPLPSPTLTPLPPRAHLGPVGPAMSGARTAPHLPKPDIVEVSSSAILDERSVTVPPPTRSRR